MLATFNLISETLQLQRKLGSVDGCRILLRLEETALLQCARLSIFSLSHIEDDCMSMKLRRGIAVNWTSGVMLEGSSDELACCLGRMDVTYASLCVSLQLLQRDSNTFAMRLTHAIIATHKGC